MRDGFILRRSSVVLLMAVLMLFGLAADADVQAQTGSPKTYTYEALPGVFPHSAGQLWQLRGAGETDIATVVFVHGSGLRVDTTGGAPSVYWRILGDSPGWEGAEFPVTVELRLKINKMEGRRAFSFEVTDAQKRHAIVNFTDSAVQIGSNADVFEIDTTEWHTYRFEFTPHAVILYVDGDDKPVRSWSIGKNEGRAPQINFGDTSSGWSGAYDLAYIKFTVH